MNTPIAPARLRATSETHQRLESGTVLLMITDKTIDAKQATSTLVDAFALTAGLTGPPTKRRSVEGIGTSMEIPESPLERT